LPSPKPPPTTSPPPKINRIEVNDSGRVTLDGEPLEAAALKEKLRLLKAADPELSVVVKGADDADYQHIVSVLDVLQQLDITKVGLATVWK
jgi:biopolymer transport protein ExbD